MVGDITRLKLQKPTHNPLDSNPIINTQVLNFIAHGDIHPKQDIVSFDKQLVHFADNSSEEVDIIVFATGYKNSYPVLQEILNFKGETPKCTLNIIPKFEKELYIMGMFETNGAAFPILSLQANLISLCIDKSNWDVVESIMLGFENANLQGPRNFINSQRHFISCRS